MEIVEFWHTLEKNATHIMIFLPHISGRKITRTLVRCLHVYLLTSYKVFVTIPSVDMHLLFSVHWVDPIRCRSCCMLLFLHVFLHFCLFPENFYLRFFHCSEKFSRRKPFPFKPCSDVLNLRSST